MKYIKLFEDHGHEPSSLADTIDPANWEAGDDEYSTQDRFWDTVDAVEWTAELFGMRPSPEKERLVELGLYERDEMIRSMPIREIVCLQNTLLTTYLDMEIMRSMVRKFPGLFGLDAQGDINMSHRATKVAGEEFGDITATAWEDEAGYRAVLWETPFNFEVYMLKSDLNK